MHIEANKVAVNNTSDQDSFFP